MLFNSTTRFTNLQPTPKGIATLDFGSGNVSSEVIVTGVDELVDDSVVLCEMRVESTTEHSIDDLLIDPIRLLVKDLVAGVGFTIYGMMDNAKANGTYKIQWILR